MVKVMPPENMRYGKRKPGSRRGVPNKITRDLKEAIHLAASTIGLDGAGFGGLTGFLIRVGLQRPGSLAALLAKTLPLEIKASVMHEWDLSKLSDEELMVLAKLSGKAQKPMLVGPQNPDIVDLSSDEYETKVAEVVADASTKH